MIGVRLCVVWEWQYDDDDDNHGADGSGLYVPVASGISELLRHEEDSQTKPTSRVGEMLDLYISARIGLSTKSH